MINASGSVIESYVYDAIGNLTRKGALVQTYNAGGRPNALATSGGITYDYDLNGNVITIGTSTRLEWNAENMSTRATAGSVVTEKSFIGEAAWKKVEAGVTTYYLPSLRIENGIARKYYGAYAERFEQPGNRQLRFYHADHLGSSSVMTDQSANVVRRVSYFPWGQDRGVEGTFTPKLQFNFKEKDASGFYDYGARIYNPVTGRWLSPDTAAEEQLHRYTYVRNNPLTMTDPTGHWPTWVHDLILERAFPGLVGTPAMDAMKLGNYAVDFPETVLESHAHEHSMLAGDLLRKHNGNVATATAAAIKMTTAFENAKLGGARKDMTHKWVMRGTGLARVKDPEAILGVTYSSWFQFGEATHPGQDGISPSHRGYQLYDLKPYWKLMISPSGVTPYFDAVQYKKDMDLHSSFENRYPTEDEMRIMVNKARAQFRSVYSEQLYQYAITSPADRLKLLLPAFNFCPTMRCPEVQRR
jgi:RHS repeat-associated protein